MAAFRQEDERRFRRGSTNRGPHAVPSPEIFDAATSSDSDWHGDSVDRALADLQEGGLRRRARTVSGPQGPRVLLDGRPVLLLCSGNYLGLADHPRVREAAAEAAMRYGAGAAAPRSTSGGMRVHRRLESRLSDFTRGGTALTFGSGYLAMLGAIGALVHEGEIVVGIGAGQVGGAADGCALVGAEWAGMRSDDVERLDWALQQASGRVGLIIAEGVSAADGSIAPLRELVALARRHDARLLVDESHALGTVGPGGRGAVAAAGLEDEVDVTIGSLGKALGSQGGYACADKQLTKLLLSTSRGQLFSTALAPPSAAAALAALELLAEQPRRVEKLERNSGVLRHELAERGIPAAPGEGPILSLRIGDPTASLAVAEQALEKGLFIEAARPPAVAPDGSGLRVTVMASHTRNELRDAAQTLASVMPKQTRQAIVANAERRPSDIGAQLRQPFDGLADAA